MTYQTPTPAGGYPATPGPGEPFDGATGPDDLMRPLYGATFGQSIKRFFKNYANFKGRASRSEYWWVALFGVLLQIIPTVLYMIGVIGFTGTAVSNAEIDSEGNLLNSSEAAAAAGGFLVPLFIGLGLLIIIGLAMLVPSIAIAWRRLHDANFAGPFWFLTLTSVGSIVVLVFTLLAPKPEGRRFDVAR